MKKIQILLMLLITMAVGYAETGFFDLTEHNVCLRIDGKSYGLYEYDIMPFSVVDTVVFRVSLPKSAESGDFLYLESEYVEFKVADSGSILYRYIPDKGFHKISHVISLPEETNGWLDVTYYYNHKYLEFPLTKVVFVEKEYISDFMNDHSDRIARGHFSNLFGFTFLFFSVFCLILYAKIKTSRALILSFAFFAFVESLTQLEYLFFYRLLSMHPFLNLHLSMTFTDLHNIAVLIMVNQIFAEGRNRLIKYVIVYQVLHILYLNLWVVWNPVDLPYIVLMFSNQFLVTLSVLFLIIVKRKKVYPSSAFFIGLAHIILPALVVFIEKPGYDDVFRMLYLLVSSTIIFLFIHVIIEKYKRDRELLQIKTMDLEEKDRQFLILERDKLQSQVNFLKTQMNPHFLFNSLATLTSLIDEDQEKAVTYVEQLSIIFRYVLQAAKTDLVTLTRELDFLESYVYLLSIKYNDNLSLKTDIEPSYRSYRVPPLTLQLLVENAVKHNIIESSSPMEIHIFIDEDNMINVMHKLNSPKKVDFRRMKNSTGIGLDNLKKLYSSVSDMEPEYIKTEKEYIVRLPVITE